jgi:hypothetical protein
MEVKITACEVCRSTDDINVAKQVQMKRNFDSTDGRTFYDHLVIDRIDICDKCSDLVIESGMFLMDFRVQGHGKIEFQNPVKEQLKELEA